MKNLFPYLFAGAIVIALATVTRTAYSSIRGGGVTPNMTCNPDTNPDCSGGDGGGTVCPITCSTGTVTSTRTDCEEEACAYNPIMRIWYYAGTRFTNRQASGPNCQTNYITCWEGLACGYCVKP